MKAAPFPIGNTRQAYLVWVTGFMAFLICLVLAAGFYMHLSAARWQSQLRDHFLFQIKGGLTNDKLELLLVDIKKNTKIDRVEVMRDEEILALLAPFFDANAAARHLKLPRFIRVYPTDSAPINGLRAEILQKAGGTLLDHESTWFNNTEATVRHLQLTIAVVVLLCIGTIFGAVVMIAKVRLLFHRDVIEIVHLMGAKNRDIASVFQRQALLYGSVGALLGAGLAILLVGFLGLTAGGNWQGQSIFFAFVGPMFLAVACVIGVLCWGSTGYSVLAYLRRKR